MCILISSLYIPSGVLPVASPKTKLGLALMASATIFAAILLISL